MNYKIYNILNKYKKHFKKNILLKFNNFNDIDFYFDLKKLSHLIGLQYATKSKEKAYKIAKDILDKKIEDNYIYNEIKKYNSKYLLAAQERIDNIEIFFDNLENAALTNRNINMNKSLDAIKFLIQIAKNKFLELGLGKDITEQYYLETFLVRNNDNNVDYSLNTKILSIQIYENDKLKFFSFDEEKQERLNQAVKFNKDIKYHQALQEELKVKREKKPDIKAKIDEYKKEISSEKIERKGIKNKDLGL